jgi:hypothetical protein
MWGCNSRIMRQLGKRHSIINVPLGGMFKAGDPSQLPDGYVRELRNYVIRPNGDGHRFDCRAPFVYDSLDGVPGFAVWNDLTNELNITQAVKSSDQKLYPKSASGTGYGAGVSGLPSSTRLTSYCNFLLKLYMAFSTSAGVPSAMASFDGTNITTTPFPSLAYPSALAARAIAAFNDRIYFIAPVLVIAPQTDFGILQDLSVMADFGSTTWTKNNVTVGQFTTGGTNSNDVLYPTSTTASSVYAGRTTAGVRRGWATLDATSLTGRDRAVFLHQLKNLDPFYDMPITINARLITSWVAATPYSVGNVVNGGATDITGTIQRCTTAGTSGGGTPVWNTTVGATTNDNTVVWTCEKADNIIAQLESFVPNATVAPDFTNFYLPIKCTAAVANAEIGTQLCFFNSIVPTVKLAPIQAGFRDNIYSQGDPRKASHGCQFTFGDFYFPFCNISSAVAGTTATVNLDAVLFTELDGTRINAKNTFPLQEIAGLGTAAAVLDGRLIVAKRRGMWIMKGVSDPNEPILPETPAIQVGIIGPLAWDTSRDNYLYFISEQHVCRMKIGSAVEFIDGPGMYEAIMDQSSSTWVEKQATYNMPILRIDHAHRDVWVYTQKGKIYVWNMDTQLWNYFDTNPTGTAAEVQAMHFDPTSQRMLVSWGGAAATRFDETSDAKDTIATGGGTQWDVYNDIIPKPFELRAPRYESTLLEIGAFHIATTEQGTITLQYSTDRGTSFTDCTGYPITSWLSDPRIRLPLNPPVTGPSATIRLRRIGAGGARNWSLSGMDAFLRVHRGEYPYKRNT